MQGRIIHYNDAEGKGLIATPLRQWLFHIGQWRSDVAPSPNQRVRLLLQDDSLLGVERISSFDLLRTFVRSSVDHLGWPVLITHAAFVLSLLLTIGSRGTATGALSPTQILHLPDLPWTFIVCITPLLPLLSRRSRWPWLALLLPLAVVLSWPYWPYPDTRSLPTLATTFWLPLVCSAAMAVLALRRLFHPLQAARR